MLNAVLYSGPLLGISLFISITLHLTRLGLLSTQNKFVLQLQEKILKLTEKFKIFGKVTAFSYFFTWNLFIERDPKIFKLVTWLSSIIYYIGIGVRFYIIYYDGTVPYLGLIFFAVALNGIFRLIVFLGILVRTSGRFGPLLESLISKKPPIPPTIPNVPPQGPSNLPPDGSSDNNQNRNYKEHYDSQNGSQYQYKTFYWTRVAGVSALVGTGILIVQAGFDLKSYHDHGQIIQERNAEINKNTFYKKSLELERERSEILERRNTLLQEQRDSYARETAEWRVEQQNRRIAEAKKHLDQYNKKD